MYFVPVTSYCCDHILARSMVRIYFGSSFEVTDHHVRGIKMAGMAMVQEREDPCSQLGVLESR